MVLKFQLGSPSTVRYQTINRAIETMMRAPLGPQSKTNLSAVAQAYGYEAAMRSAARDVADGLLQSNISMQTYLNTPSRLRKPALVRAIHDFNEIVAECMHSEGEGHGMLMLGYMDDELLAYGERNKCNASRSA